MQPGDNKLVPPVKRKPPAAGMGRKKGSVNKSTKAIKDMILAALDKTVRMATALD
jgi:hypothetical protein